mmetsp:Transcript_42683/g.120606  ORF Transcript_42683/g.120606 Transcript_42683/m.120606 type:complete len:405 (+) Transcript_42683:112-1326(+)
MPGGVRSSPPAALSTHATFEEQYPRTPSRGILGRGAFGTVFAVTSPQDPDRRYVAKEINISALSPEKQRKTLVEIQLLRSLDHPNIVAFVDAVLVEATLHIVMECATGGDLAQKIRAQRDAEELFAERTIMGAFVQVLVALKFVHERRILHRDVKPANMFVFGLGALEQCTIKLGDFGLGKSFDATTLEANSVVGSPSYFSPEVCRGRPYGRKSDVWSAGVVLHELASLSVPFVAKSIVAAVVMICKTEAPPLPEGYSKDLRDLTGRLMQKDPAARPSLAALLEEPFLQQFASSAKQKVDDAVAPVAICGQAPTFARQMTEQEPEAELSQSHSCSMGAAGAIQDALGRMFPDGMGVVSTEVVLQLLPLVVPGMSRATAIQVLAAADCKEDAVDLGAFVKWLSTD